MQTIKQIWDSTPWGQAIRDENYLALCKFVEEKRIPKTLVQLNWFIPIWNLTPKQAEKAIQAWLDKNLRREPNFLEEMREIERKKFLA